MVTEEDLDGEYGGREEWGMFCEMLLSSCPWIQVLMSGGGNLAEKYVLNSPLPHLVKTP